MAQWAWVAVPGMFLLAFGSSLLASSKPFSMIALTLCVPVAGVGLSYGGLENSMGLGLLIIVGSIVAYGWSLCFKGHESPAAVTRQENTLIILCSLVITYCSVIYVSPMKDECRVVKAIASAFV